LPVKKALEELENIDTGGMMGSLSGLIFSLVFFECDMNTVSISHSELQEKIRSSSCTLVRNIFQNISEISDWFSLESLKEEAKHSEMSNNLVCSVDLFRS
jgi:hypothetical protein